MDYIISNEHMNAVIEGFGTLGTSAHEMLLRHVCLTYTSVAPCAVTGDEALTRGNKSTLTKLKRSLSSEDLNRRGVMYAQTGSFKMAAELFRSAAEKGEARACRNLCYMYEFGVGVPQDSVEAEAWRERASLEASDRVHDKIMEMLKA